MRTGELFRFCVGRKFTIHGFDRYGYLELQVDDDPVVKRKFGLNGIWVEPQFVELISKTRRPVDRPENGLWAGARTFWRVNENLLTKANR